MIGAVGDWVEGAFGMPEGGLPGRTLVVVHRVSAPWARFGTSNGVRAVQTVLAAAAWTGRNDLNWSSPGGDEVRIVGVRQGKEALVGVTADRVWLTCEAPVDYRRELRARLPAKAA